VRRFETCVARVLTACFTDPACVAVFVRSHGTSVGDAWLDGAMFVVARAALARAVRESMCRGDACGPEIVHVAGEREGIGGAQATCVEAQQCVCLHWLRDLNDAVAACRQ
jgi:hypothetical protein